MIRLRPIILILVIGFFLPLSFSFAGTVLNSYKYAWSDNIGYINFENVSVDDNILLGYAWSKNSGWIKFNPAKGGVLNDGTGNLSGYAWGESLGWINFDNVSINGTTGKFSGTAMGTLAGTITFDCPTYCDVRTDWRETVVTSSGGGGNYSSVQPLIIPKHISTIDEPLVILPSQSGNYTFNTPDGPLILEIPANDLSEKTTFFVSLEQLTLSNQYLMPNNTNLVNGVFYNIWAEDKNGNAVKYFVYPLTISLPVPSKLQGAKNLAVYWLNETNSQWVLIPDAIFLKDKVTFQVNHLTKFAIFEKIDEILKIPSKPSPSLPFVPEKNPTKQGVIMDQSNPGIVASTSTSTPVDISNKVSTSTNKIISDETVTIDKNKEETKVISGEETKVEENIINTDKVKKYLFFFINNYLNLISILFLIILLLVLFKYFIYKIKKH